MSEEKKLTDEEIQAAWDNCEKYWVCPNCPLYKLDCKALIKGIINNQKAEIERLTEEANEETIKFIDICTENLLLRKNNRELQKQVDELKEEREKMQAEIMRFEDMKFAQEHCDMYSENEWLKDMLRQYMNGEIVNENVFCQSVEEMREALKYRTKEIYEEAKRIYDNDSNYEDWFSDSSFGRQFKYFIESKGVEVE